MIIKLSVLLLHVGPVYLKKMNLTILFTVQLKGVTVSLSNVSDSSKWQSSPIYDCVTIPNVSPPPPEYMYKITCHQMASAVILHRDNNDVIGLMEIEVYSEEGII